MSARDKFLKIALPLLILAVGIGGAVLMIKSRQAPVKQKPDTPGALVQVETVEVADHPVEVHATGTVQPHRQTEIVPQVSGRVTEVSPHFVAGGFFEKGELLFALEKIDYRLAVDQAAAALARAELNLATVESRARVARQEWEELRQDQAEQPNPLVVYEPQLKEAEANVRSARAALEQARINLRRTQIRAPFDARVASESIDLGRYVRPGSPVAVLTGTGTAEIVVPLALEELSFLRIPGEDGAETGSKATVRLDVNDHTYKWQGRIVRALGEMDPRGRMARIVVAIEDPYQLHAGESGRPDLAMGLFVDLILHGSTIENVVRIPRRALREKKTVWVVDEAGELDIRTVEIARRERDDLLISAGLESGDRVVLTNLSGAADGMKLRIAEAEGQDR
ncbi:MAG: efflux RND transporter periplasmic adaptor subunit [Desulfuromonadales bacterium]|nr:efflux RND transporter periplasmic adaptor subunit [Desulfuromonadales bacterium]NIS42822.1 efflux RND transporter periplasmic adaptor subunit [Desulfuromonadales bacterium]